VQSWQTKFLDKCEQPQPHFERYIGRMSQRLQRGKIRDSKTIEEKVICVFGDLFLFLNNN